MHIIIIYFLPGNAKICKTLLNGAKGYEGRQTTTNTLPGLKDQTGSELNDIPQDKLVIIISFCQSMWNTLSSSVLPIKGEVESALCPVKHEISQLVMDYPQSKWGLHLLPDGPRHPVMHEISQLVMDYPQAKWGLL